QALRAARAGPARDAPRQPAAAERLRGAGRVCLERRPARAGSGEVRDRVPLQRRAAAHPAGRRRRGRRAAKPRRHARARRLRRADAARAGGPRGPRRPGGGLVTRAGRGVLCLAALVLAVPGTRAAAGTAAVEPSYEIWDGYLLDTEVGNYPLQFRIAGDCGKAEAFSNVWPPTAFEQALRCKGRIGVHMKTFFSELELSGEVAGDEAAGSWRSGERQGRWKAWREETGKAADNGDTRRAAVDRLVDLMTPLYPFWELKGSSPEALRKGARKAAAQARTH